MSPTRALIAASLAAAFFLPVRAEAAKDERPPVILSSITVQGNVDVSERVIRRALELMPSKPLDLEKTIDGKESLYASGCFESIEVDISTPTPTIANAAVVVRERPAKYVRGGVGYGTQTKERLTVGFENHNFLGDLRQLDLKATYSGFITQPHKYRTAILEGNLIQPFLFGSRFEGQLHLSREWDDREAYDAVSNNSRVTLLRRYTKSLNASLRYRYSGTRLTRVSPEAETTPDQTQIGAMGPTVNYDATDDRFLPMKGWRVIGTWEEGLQAFGSDVEFHKLEGRTGRFDTLSGWTFFEGIQSGAIIPHSTDPSDIIPIYERYFLGGANTVRGFSERDLGPKDVEGSPLGGESFLVGNFEIRHPIYKKIFGVAFLDAGQLYVTEEGEVWPHVRLHGWNDLAYGTGGGIRVHTPVGALRLEMGYQLNHQRGTSFWDRTSIHFSIGEVF